MEIKNVKLGDYSLKDLLKELLRLGDVDSSYEKSYDAMRDKIISILAEL